MINRNNKTSRKNICIGLLSVLVVSILLAGAFYVPEILTRLEDKRTLEQVNILDVELSTYKLSYQSFAEKLHTIGLALSQDVVVESIQLVEESSTISNEELTELAMAEVEELLNGELGMNVFISPENLAYRELYTVYGRAPEGGENLLAGIQYYRLTYELTDYDGYDYMMLQLYLDTEFYKLYGYYVDTMQSNIASNDGFLATEEERYAIVEGSADPGCVLTDYWGLEEAYSIRMEKSEYSNWGDVKKDGGVFGNTYILFEEDDAQLVTFQEYYWEYGCWVGRNGLFLE